jgi:geranylgeranyl diphosphate synthase type I
MTSKSNFQSYFEKSRRGIDASLQTTLREFLKEVKLTSPQILPLVEEFANSCTGGKRIRGSLVKLGCELSGGKPSKDITAAAVAYEIFQTAILAHDDIIDKSLLRRNKPSLYSALGGDHKGISHAICLADIGFFLTYKILGTLKIPDSKKVKVIQSFSDAMIYTVFGEMLDVELSYPNKNRSSKDVFDIHGLKTAWYTIIEPLTIGGIIAGANTKLLTSFAQFGHSLGIAYQIQDDILGVFGDEKILGKSVQADIEENKNTLLITYALGAANPKQKKILRQYYGAGKITKSQLQQVRTVFIETGALAKTEKSAQTYLQSGKKLIAKITKSKNHQLLLNELADYLVNRQK